MLTFKLQKKSVFSKYIIRPGVRVHLKFFYTFQTNTKRRNLLKCRNNY